MEQIQIGKLVLAVAPEVAQSSEASSAHAPKPERKAEPRRNVAQSKLILAIAKKHGFKNVRIIGYGDLVDRPTELNGWLVMRKEAYKPIIPPEVLEQAEILTKGIPLKGFLVAEDQRHIEKPQRRTLTLPTIQPNWRKIATVAGKVTAVVAIGAAVVSMLPVVLGVMAVGAALTYDPLLIAVTEENEWIVVGEWWD